VGKEDRMAVASSPVKVVSFAIAKPDTSNVPAAILISRFFILLSLGLINV
jgi:hypothetical protein